MCDNEGGEISRQPLPYIYILLHELAALQFRALVSLLVERRAHGSPKAEQPARRHLRLDKNDRAVNYMDPRGAVWPYSWRCVKRDAREKGEACTLTRTCAHTLSPIFRPEPAPPALSDSLCPPLCSRCRSFSLAPTARREAGVQNAC